MTTTQQMEIQTSHMAGYLLFDVLGIKCLRLQILVIEKDKRFVNGGFFMKATGIVRRIDDLGRVVVP